MRITVRICAVTTRSSARTYRAGRPTLLRYPADAQGATERGQLPPRHRLDTPWKWGLFLTSSRAAWRISISMAFFPSARSSSLMRSCAARRALAGTTSSSAPTAAVLPFVLSWCQRRTTEGEIANSRATS